MADLFSRFPQTNTVATGLNANDNSLGQNAMQYQIITAQSLLDLEKMVNNEMRHDWSATGGLISFTRTLRDEILADPVQHFAQAMIRSAPQPSKPTKNIK